MFEAASTIDNGFYARQWGLRRSRFRDNSSPAPTDSRYIQTLNAGSASPSVTTKVRPPLRIGEKKWTVDCNNAVWMTLKRNLANSGISYHVDTGGPFYSEEFSISRPTYVNAFWNGGASTAQAIGYFNPTDTMSLWTDRLYQGALDLGSPKLNDSDLKGYGATAISRTIPTQPEMNLSTSIAELKDGLPSMIGRELSKSRDLFGASSEYLNYQFGVAPMISDISDVITLTKRYEEILKQFKRDQGRLVRRRLTLVDEYYRNEKTRYGGPVYCYAGDWASKQAMFYADYIDVTRKGHHKVWFSGAYSLAYPKDLDPLLQQITEFNRVYGVIPDPTTAWEMIPFSFLVDWFTNVGDIIKNVSYLGPATSLAYGYIMREDRFDEEHFAPFGPDYYWTRQNDPSRVEIRQTASHVVKRRIKASPFGFSTDFSNLSEKQKSILTALGVSRMRL